MDNTRLKLHLTESAYYAVLDHTFKPDLKNPLPALIYNQHTNEYEIRAYSYEVVEKMISEYRKKGKTLVYQVGCINLCIENTVLISEIKEKVLDYMHGKFFIKMLS